MTLGENPKLRTNFIGHIFGIDSICIEIDKLNSIRNGVVISSIPLEDIQGFAIYKSGIFGGRLFLLVNGQTKHFRFLKSERVIDFQDHLNRIIAQNICKHVNSSFDIFTKFVFDEYPRDSKAVLLGNLCKHTSEVYCNKEQLWNRYISNEVIEKAQLLISNHPIDLSALQERHEVLLLKKRKKFFDCVESNPLTSEQRLAVLRSNDKNTVLAAAGTGKTSVMVAKALDIIDRKLAEPSEILLLAYNRDAAAELQERLFEKATNSNITLDESPQISTFHALGKKTLKKFGISTHISELADDDLKLNQWVTKWIKDYLRSDSSRVYDFIELSMKSVNPFDFKAETDYEQYIRDNEYRTLNNDLVKGYQELQIANFLYINQIPYGYETPYISKRHVDAEIDYRPDFYLKGTNIYIEHFGIDRQGRTRADIDAKKYLESMDSKRALHKEHETIMIETFHYEWCEDNLLTGLEEKLIAVGIMLDPMEPSKIFEKLNDKVHVANWSYLMKMALQAIRVERLDKKSIKNRLVAAKIHRPERYSNLLEALHQGYIRELNDQKAIDFDDMIIKAIQLITQGEFKPKWKYILIDEFQDISAARMQFVQALVENGPDPSLTVVGDDWQSIYRFSGGKLELTTRFGEIVGKHTETKLQKTFRYNDSIAYTAGRFIMENPEQFQKDIDAHNKVDQSQIFLLDDKVGKQNGVYERVAEVVQKIRENDNEGSIAVIARYRYLLSRAKQAVSIASLKKNIHFWTFHSAKGQEADYCILIGLFQGERGFPAEKQNRPIIEALLPSKDAYLHSEERRLLYVGITRAKHKVYMIADPTAPSDFIIELLSPKYKLNIVSKAFQEQYRKILKCPTGKR